jgi:hypothetical protein
VGDTSYFEGRCQLHPWNDRPAIVQRNGAAEVPGVRIDDAQLWYPPQAAYLVTDI